MEFDEKGLVHLNGHCSECCPNRRPAHHDWTREIFKTVVTVLTTTGVFYALKLVGL